MKHPHAIKIVGFLTLVFTVALGAYAWAQAKNRPKPASVEVLVRFGWNANSHHDLDCVDRTASDIASYAGFKKPDGSSKDVTRYKIAHYLNGNIQTNISPEDAGQLDVCLDQTASPAVTSSEVSPSGPIKGNKTQTAGVASFATGTAADDFVTFLNSRGTSRSKPGHSKH
jgi:hypothetical protein